MPNTDRTPIYHVVSHTHWDREWLAPAEHSRPYLAEFLKAVLEDLRNERLAGFTLDGHSLMVQDGVELSPNFEQEIAHFAQEGKLEIGPWYTLADEFLPSAESHVANLLYGMKKARRYGQPLMVGYLPDQFGHIAQMPQLLRDFGIECALIYRGFGGEPGQEASEYRWEAPDGSAVFMYHLPKDGYSFAYFADDKENGLLRRFERIHAELEERSALRNRLLLNGGDRHWPDPKIDTAIETIRAQLNVEIRSSTLREYFAAAMEEAGGHSLPLHRGESRFGLRHAFAVIGGTASSRIYVKQSNYECQTLLEKVLEPFNAYVLLFGNTNRKEIIEYCRRELLKNQNHDVICGTCVDSVYADVMQRYENFRHAVRAGIELLFDDLVPVDPKAQGDDTTVFIFNPLPRERAVAVQQRINFHIKDISIGINPDAVETPEGPPVMGFTILDADGTPVPFQILNREESYAVTENRHGYPRQYLADSFDVLLFLQQASALGIRSLRIKRRFETPAFDSLVRADKQRLENSFVRLEIGPNGALRLIDKTTGTAFEDFMRFECAGDDGDCYTYCPSPNHEPTEYSVVTGKVVIMENGPVHASLRVYSEIPFPGDGERSLRITTTFSLCPHSRSVHVAVAFNNACDNYRLRAVFTTKIATNESYAGGHFAVIHRQHREYNQDEFVIEKPQNLEVLQDFVTVQDQERGFTVFTKGLPEYDLSPKGDGVLAITLLRCVDEISKSNLATRPGGDAAWKHKTPDAQCHGERLFEFAIMAHQPTESFSEVTRESENYHWPVVAATRKGAPAIDLPSSLLEVNSNHLVCSAVKSTVEGNDVILRWYNPVAIPDTAQIALHTNGVACFASRMDETDGDQLSVSDTYTVSTAAYQVKTIRIHPDEANT